MSPAPGDGARAAAALAGRLHQGQRGGHGSWVSYTPQWRRFSMVFPCEELAAGWLILVDYVVDYVISGL